MARLVGRKPVSADVRKPPASPVVSADPAPPSLPSSSPQSVAPSPMLSDRASVNSDRTTSTSITVGSKITAVGRAGLVRTGGMTNGFNSPTMGHLSAYGRGHSSVVMMQQNYQPFLDKTYLIPRGAAEDGSNHSLQSHVSMESSFTRATHHSVEGLRIENYIYIDVEIILHEGSNETPISHKTLGFDGRSSVRNVMSEICSYLDIENPKPLYLFCKNTGAKLEDGTLFSNKIESEFLFEFHLVKEAIIDTTSTHSTENKFFVTRFNPTTVYLTLILFNAQKQVLALPGGMLPSIEISTDATITEEFGPEHKEFVWAKTKSMDWENSALEMMNRGVDEESVFTPQALKKQMAALDTVIAGALPNKANSQSMKSLKFRKAFIEACIQFQSELNLNRLGFLYHVPVSVSSLTNTYSIVAVQFCSHSLDVDVMMNGKMKWRTSKNIQPNFFSLDDDQIWALYLQYYQRCKNVLAPGVYVGLFRLKNTTDSLDILTLKHDPDLIPLTRFRIHNSDIVSVSPSAQSVQSSISRVSPLHEVKKTSVALLGENELSYLRYMAEKELNPAAKQPAELTITKELEALGQQLRNTIKLLSQQTGVELDLKNYSSRNPIMFRKDCMVLLLTSTEEMKTEAAADKKDGIGKAGGFLKKLAGLGVSKKTDQKDSLNDNYFQYLPMALFESIHHHSFNEQAHASYRRQIDAAYTDQLKYDVMEEKSAKALASTNSSNLQQVLADLNEKKKTWNNSTSWALQLIQQNRNSMFKGK